jgi:phosphoribosylamine--glycine ligase
MGTYGPAPVVTKDRYDDIERDVIEPLVRGMAQEGAPFKGTLFANMMISHVGEASLLEVNVRFGDPETQVLMNLIDGDLARLLYSAALGKLDTSVVSQSGRHGLCVVLAAAGYPGDVRRGDPIEGIAAAEAVPGVSVYHAGTRREGDRVFTSGGRVLGVTATANRFEDAHALAYAACECIRFDGMQYRRDIGRSAFVSAPSR